MFLKTVYALAKKEVNCEVTLNVSSSCVIKNQTINTTDAVISDWVNRDITIKLRIQSKDIKFLPINIAENFPNLIDLVASECSLKRIKKAFLSDLNKLKVLDFSRNSITDIEAESFDDLNDLEDLNLSNNYIENLSPRIFMKLIKVRRVNLGGNNIKFLDDTLVERNLNLARLDVYQNGLIYISSKMFTNNKNLSLLDLRENECINATFLSDAILGLRLTNCSFDELREEVVNLESKLSESEVNQRLERKVSVNTVKFLFDLFLWPIE